MIDAGTLLARREQTMALCRRAGEAILATVRQLGAIEEKADGSPVTRADRAAHDVLMHGLRALDAGIAVISEEGDLQRSIDAAGEDYWLVYPLDGTKEFIKGRPEYTVNVALVESGVPILGAIYVPAADRLYVGGRGLGSQRIDCNGAARLEPPRVDRPRSAVVSRSHLTPATEQLLDRMGIVERASFGSSLKVCAVAEGTADFYPRLGPTCLWDTAAGTAIALEAGCAVVDLSGEPLRYGLADGLTRPGFLVCAPGGCLDECLCALTAV